MVSVRWAFELVSEHPRLGHEAEDGRRELILALAWLLGLNSFSMLSSVRPDPLRPVMTGTSALPFSQPVQER